MVKHKVAAVSRIKKVKEFTKKRLFNLQFYIDKTN